VAEATALGWQFKFRRWMNPEILSQWRCMRDDLVMVALNGDRDKLGGNSPNQGFSLLNLFIINFRQ
jgi:hypothetical protein